LITEPLLPSTLNHSQPGQPVSGHGWRLWFSRHNWLTWLGLCFILPLVIYYWQHYSEHLRQQQHAVFQQHADRIEQQLQQRLKHIELLLAANAAYVSSSEYVSQAEWQHYVESLKLPQLYPGIQALGVVSYRRAVELPILLEQLNRELQRRQGLAQSVATVTLHPGGDRSHYAIVSHIQPATPQNSQVLGYDMLTDPLRTQTAMRAASLNQPAITGKVSLQQDGERAQQPGLVLMLPLYQHNVPLTTAEQKQAALLGFVYAAFRVRDILPDGWRDPATVLPDLRWSSGLEVDAGQLLFERRSGSVAVASTTTAAAASLLPSVALHQHRHLDWYGQPFVLHIKNNQMFERELLPLAEYELVLLGSAALVLLFLLLSHLNLRRYQAECHADQLQQHVQQQRQLLLLDEQRQSLALKASQLAWFEFDLRTGSAFYADIWWRMFDFTGPQLNPEPQQLFDLLHPSALALFRQDLQRLLAHGPDQDLQHYRFVSRQGRQLYCLVHFYVVRAAEGDAIRLCCTIQDQTLQQQLTDARRQLAALCQLEVSLAVAHCETPSATADSGLFLQQHLSWLLQFYCEALAGTEPVVQPLPSVSSPPLVPVAQVVQLIADVVQLYQPQATSRDLQLLWQPQSISELLKLDRHRGWQMACGLLELACVLATPGSAVTLELLPFQTRLTFRLQLQLSDVVARQCAQELAALVVNPAQATTLLQQRLQAARFWAAQLAGEFSYQQTQAPEPQSQQLSLQLQFPAAG
jgi:CHASE1-domain containing sensor protein